MTFQRVLETAGERTVRASERCTLRFTRKTESQKVQLLIKYWENLFLKLSLHSLLYLFVLLAKKSTKSSTNKFPQGNLEYESIPSDDSDA